MRFSETLFFKKVLTSFPRSPVPRVTRRDYLVP